jgi:hypothetical protein
MTAVGDVYNKESTAFYHTIYIILLNRLIFHAVCAYM